VSEVEFDARDVAEIWFGIGPIWETVTSLWALSSPARHAIHLPWIKFAQPLTRRRDLVPHVELLTAFARPRAWLPDFLTPPPVSPLQDIDADLAILAATPLDVVRSDIEETTRGVPLLPLAAQVAAEPDVMLPRLVDAVRAWYIAAIDPHWPRMQALLEADIAYRARQLASGGAKLLFDTLHATTHWEENRLVIDHKYDLRLRVDGRGFPLMPSIFADKGLMVTTSNTNQPTAAYPARAVGTLWEGVDRPRAGQPSAALAGVLGPARARLLELLRSPGTTTDLAHRTGLTAGAISQHLALLYDARLVQRNRQGRSVYYLCTELGEALLGDEAPL
jgi:DNA-binding transcriptional ArsR family regulator